MLMDGEIIVLVGAMAIGYASLWYKFGRLEQEVKDIKKYVLKLNGDL